ncbi:protein mard1 [Fagus crenata]
MSPTSILDSKPFSRFRSPFWSETNAPRTLEPETKRHWDNLDPKGIGLAIVDALNEEKSDPKPSKPESRMVLFGSQLKIQIPPLPNSVLSPAESPKSLADFGIKTRNSPVSPGFLLFWLFTVTCEEISIRISEIGHGDSEFLRGECAYSVASPRHQDTANKEATGNMIGF